LHWNKKQIEDILVKANAEFLGLRKDGTSKADSELAALWQKAAVATGLCLTEVSDWCAICLYVLV
jgi:hypothetical protein